MFTLTQNRSFTFEIYKTSDASFLSTEICTWKLRHHELDFLKNVLSILFGSAIFLNFFSALYNFEENHCRKIVTEICRDYLGSSQRIEWSPKNGQRFSSRRKKFKNVISSIELSNGKNQGIKSGYFNYSLLLPINLTLFCILMIVCL